MLKHLSVLVICLLVAIPTEVFADISIIASGDVYANCASYFRVRATGSAGPFVVEVSGPISTTYSNVSGEVLIDNLCNGTYTVAVYGDRFPTCVTTLSITLSNSTNLLGDASVAKTSARIAPLDLRVSPNPSTGVAYLEARTGHAAGLAETDWEATVLDGNGRTVRKLRVLPTAAGAGFAVRQKLDFQELPAGNYFLRLTTSTGEEATVKVLLR